MNILSTPYSSLKLFAHPEELQKIYQGQRVAPIYVRIKPTNRCNHSCSYCHYGKGQYLDLHGQENPHQIPWEPLKQTLQQMAQMGVKAVTFSGGGEPLVYPEIVQAMKLVTELGIDLSIITNGHLLSDERARILAHSKWVRISLDAASPHTYAQIRGLQENALDEVCENIRRFAKVKDPHCELGINAVVHHINAAEVYEIARLMKSLGVNHVKFAPRMTANTLEYHEPFRASVCGKIHQAEEDLNSSTFKIINLYEGDLESRPIFERPYSRCVVKEVFCVVAADSKVYFCHNKAYLENGVVGDLTKQSFKEIWFSDEVIQRYRTFDANKECHHYCVFDSRNLLLNAFLDMDRNHINFI